MKEDIDVGMRCIKYMLFTTNFMFALIGFLLISVGSTITSIYNDFELFMAGHYFSPSALLIAIGVIILFVSLFGCFSAIRKSTCLINTYGVLLSVVLILEISAAIAAYSMRANIVEYVENAMIDSLQHLDDPRYGSYYNDSWDFLQERLECCGIKNSSDWKNIAGAPRPPDSCLDPNVPHIFGRSSHLYSSGCLRRLTFIVSECAGLVGTGGICVAIVQLLGVVFAFMLAKSIRRLKTAAEVQRQENQRFYAQLANSNSEMPSPKLYAAQHSEA